MIPPTLTRVAKSRPCVVCGKPNWCMAATDGTEAICCRVESDHPVPGLLGWRHPMNGTPIATARVVYSQWKSPQASPEMARLTMKYTDALGEGQLEQHAKSLGVSEAALSMLACGWSRKHQAYTFPMRDHRQQIIGIRLRNYEGKKWAIDGSNNGLFMAEFDDPMNPILVCEGPTDTAAMLDLGFDAIGRSSCRGEVEMLVQFAKSHSRDWVIVSDIDGPGVDGAAQLTAKLIPHVRSVRVIRPLRGKDAREWVCKGATRETVEAVIESVTPARRKA